MEERLFEYFLSKEGKSLDVESDKKDIHILLKYASTLHGILDMRFVYNKEYVDIGIMIDDKGFIVLSAPKGLILTGITKIDNIKSFSMYFKTILRVWAEDIPDIEDEMAMTWKNNTIDEALNMDWKDDE